MPTNWAGPLPPYLDKIQKNSILSLWGRPWARPLDQEESQPRVNAWHRPKYIAPVSCRKRKGQEHIPCILNTLENLVLSEFLIHEFNDPGDWTNSNRELHFKSARTQTAAWSLQADNREFTLARLKSGNVSTLCSLILSCYNPRSQSLASPMPNKSGP